MGKESVTCVVSYATVRSHVNTRVAWTPSTHRCVQEGWACVIAVELWVTALSRDIIKCFQTNVRWAVAKKYRGSFTVREVHGESRRGRKKSNPRAVVAILLFLFLAWFLYIRSHRVATYTPQRANLTR